MIFFTKKTRELFRVLSKLMIALSACAVSFTYAEIESHDIAYQQALDKVEFGYNQLREELGRIHNGEVAHFDFLQSAHIEVLRHARALQHPPADIDLALREPMIAHATQLGTLAESLELVLSDFLRSHALLDNALSNTIDLAQQASMESKEPTQAALRALVSAANQFRVSAQPDRLLPLQVAYENVIKDKSIRQSYLESLVLQQGLIETHAGAYPIVIAKIEASELAQALRSLRAVYRETGNG